MLDVKKSWHSWKFVSASSEESALASAGSGNPVIRVISSDPSTLTLALSDRAMEPGREPGRDDARDPGRERHRGRPGIVHTHKKKVPPV